MNSLCLLKRCGLLVPNDTTKGAIRFLLELCQDLLHKLPGRMPYANTERNGSLNIHGDSLVVLKRQGRRSSYLFSLPSQLFFFFLGNRLGPA
jgi:hypothetical protein